GLAIGARSDHQPLHVLDAPSAAHEFRGEPVQQFGMRWAIAHDAKVAWSSYNAFSEMMLPEAVHHHARGERIRRVGDPVRKRRSAAGRVEADWRNDLRRRRIQD